MARLALKKLEEQTDRTNQQMIRNIETLEQLAGSQGFHVTARALNQAKNAFGWELAGDILAAGKAARGERPHTRKRS